MTLIVALKYKDGAVLATDSRVMVGPIKRDRARKLVHLNEHIAVAAAGLLGAIDDIIRPVKEICNSREEYATFIIISSDRIRRICGKGYEEEANDYACDGSGMTYGEYILGNFYKELLEMEEAKELAIYTILETSKMDPNVSEDIQMTVFSKGKKCEIINPEEIEDIKIRSAPLSKNSRDTLTRNVENIVKIREELNNLWERTFGFKLLLQSEIISNLRDLLTLRSKKFPIHVTDPKFVEVVLKVTKKFPPNWSDLYLKSLDLYIDSLNKLLISIQKTHQN
jgi:20S proteasome alpha/beta subunit